MAKKAVKKKSSANKAPIRKSPVRKTVKKTAAKPSRKASVRRPAAKKTTTRKTLKMNLKCVKCGGTRFDIGEIKVGKVFHSHDFGYRSKKHNPYADHVGQQHVKVCLSCGFAELYFDIEDLGRKTNK